MAVRVGRGEGERRSSTVNRVDLVEPMPRDLEITVRSAWNRDRGVSLADPIVARLLCVASSEPAAAETADLALGLARALEGRAASGFPGPPEAVQ